MLFAGRYHIVVEEAVLHACRYRVIWLTLDIETIKARLRIFACDASKAIVQQSGTQMHEFFGVSDMVPYDPLDRSGQQADNNMLIKNLMSVSVGARKLFLCDGHPGRAE